MRLAAVRSEAAAAACAAQARFGTAAPLTAPSLCPPRVPLCSDVAAVDISGLDKLGGGGGGGSTPSPTPSPSPTPAPEGGAVAPPAVPAVQQCDKTFAQVAGETSGLSLLKTVVSQAQFSSALPDPSGNYTLFAPTDAAFFGLLSAFSERLLFAARAGRRTGGRRRARARPAWLRHRGGGNPAGPQPCVLLTALTAPSLPHPIPRPQTCPSLMCWPWGDKLTAVLLYHVAPGSLTPEQLAKGAC